MAIKRNSSIIVSIAIKGIWIKCGKTIIKRHFQIEILGLALIIMIVNYSRSLFKTSLTKSCSLSKFIYNILFHSFWFSFFVSII